MIIECLLQFLCTVMAILLHFLWLCVFSWLFLEGLHVYRMLSELRDINYGPHALLLPDWLGRAGLRHGSGGGTGPRGLREPGLLLALALRHPRLESGGSRRVRGVGECSPLFAQTIDPSHETVTTRLTLSPTNAEFPRFLCSHCYTLGGAITHLLNESRITRSKTQTRKTQKPAISYAYEK